MNNNSSSNDLLKRIEFSILSSRGTFAEWKIKICDFKRFSEKIASKSFENKMSKIQFWLLPTLLKIEQLERLLALKLKS